MAETDILIQADQITRRFPGGNALSDVSFQVRRGEIMALLGPNGSGKTTTLRILASYLAPTAGCVQVAGHDLATHSLEARRRIGYLPESAPLHLDMRVDEYLRFRGCIHGLRGTRLAARLRSTLDRCGLGDVSRRTLASLSRGFRQRTALADCLLHEPDVLLLDEPMTGLDPAQVQTTQDILRESAQQGAVLFSTHVLAEAEEVGHQALILNAGRVAANDTPARLARSAAHLRVEMFVPADRLASALEALPGAHDLHLKALPDGWMDVSIRTGQEDLSDVLRDLAQQEQWPLRGLRRDAKGFADTYLRLTTLPPRVQNPKPRTHL